MRITESKKINYELNSIDVLSMLQISGLGLTNGDNELHFSISPKTMINVIIDIVTGHTDLSDAGIMPKETYLNMRTEVCNELSQYFYKE